MRYQIVCFRGCAVHWKGKNQETISIFSEKNKMATIYSKKLSDFLHGGHPGFFGTLLSHDIY